jgi:hypothetical protein
MAPGFSDLATQYYFCKAPLSRNLSKCALRQKRMHLVQRRYAPNAPSLTLATVQKTPRNREFRRSERAFCPAAPLLRRAFEGE